MELSSCTRKARGFGQSGRSFSNSAAVPLQWGVQRSQSEEPGAPRLRVSRGESVAPEGALDTGASVMELVEGLEAAHDPPNRFADRDAASLSRFEAHFNFSVHFDRVAALYRGVITILRPRHHLA
jgi:hypothetical protein